MLIFKNSGDNKYIFLGIRGKRMKKGKIKKIAVYVAVSLASAFLLCIVAGGIYVAAVADGELDMSLFEYSAANSVAKFYVMEGGEWVEWEEARLYGDKNFEFVPIEELPQDLIDAFVAIEDKRFFEHSGVDWYRTAGAAANYILNFDSRFGASTITQQLIKNVTGKNDVSIERKVQEIVWARELERNMEKYEILEFYLNVINLSDNCYGVQSAARRYFSKDASELSLLESVCIAAITNNPYYYNPIRNPENNKYRRDVILSQMYEQGKITKEEFDANFERDIELCPDDSSVERKINSWYIDMVIEDVTADLMAEYGYSRGAASKLIYNGGLQIYIQIDREIQAIMEEYYENEANFPAGEGAQSSMIIIDPQSGDVLGVVGAIGEKSGNRIQNYATQTRRPPGSTIKPLAIYAPALEEGVITYASVYDDTPVKFERDSAGNFRAWPKNANGIYHGLSTMSYSVANSTNTVPLKILEELGLSHSFYFLRDKLGLSDLVEMGKDSGGAFITDMDYAALALGQLNYGLSVRDITAAYSIFADNGNYHSPRSYSLVKDSFGKVVLEKGATTSSVISDGNAEIMTSLLRDVVYGGTANSLTVKNKVAIACKTGTSQDNKDRWCIGYTPSLICGVWYGYEYPKEIPRAEKDIFLDAFDSVITQIYDEDIFSAYKDRRFENSADLVEAVFCMDSGKIPCEACLEDARGSRLKKGYFVKGTEPKQECDVHVLVDYDMICGGVANAFTPDEHITKVGMLNIQRSFPVQIYVSDAQYVVRFPPDNVMPSFDSKKAFFSTLEGKEKYFGTSPTATQFNRFSTAHINYSDWIFYRKLYRR